MYFRFMPIYEFHCEKCGADSELLVRSAKSKRTACPQCGSTRLTKKLSVFASGAAAGNQEAPACPGMPGNCCACAAGRAHSH